MFPLKAPGKTKPPAFCGQEFTDLRLLTDQALTSLRSERSPFFAQWRELSQFCHPQRGRFVMPPSPNDTLKGLPKQQQIIDRTATKAIKALAAFLMAGITSPARDWFRLGTLRDELNEDHDVKAWLAEVSRRMRLVFETSNFYNAMASLYEEIATFGTGCMLCLPDFENVMTFTTLTAGEYLLLTDQNGRVNTVYRELVRNVGSLVKEFGIQNVSIATRTLYEAGRFEREVNLIHAIIPNPNRKPGQVGWRGMEYLSIRYEYGRQADQCLDVAGFHEFPAIAPRWDVVATDTYGHGPAEEALPDVKMLQNLRRRHAEAVDKSAKPPMYGDAALKQSLVSMIPAGMNFVPNGSTVGMKPLFEINPNAIEEMWKAVADTRETIQGTFYGDLIAQFSQGDTPDMTAREVDERHEEKVLLLGPMLERFHGEALSPVIDVTFNRMVRVGLLPPAPANLRGQHIEPDYISLLAQAQRAVGTTSIEQLYKFAGGIAAIDPNIMDNLDSDMAVTVYADYIGVSPEIVRSAVKVAAIRQQKAQQEQAAQQAQQGMAAVQGAQALSQTDIGGGQNALSLMAGQAGLT